MGTKWLEAAALTALLALAACATGDPVSNEPPLNAGTGGAAGSGPGGGAGEGGSDAGTAGAAGTGGKSGAAGKAGAAGAAGESGAAGSATTGGVGHSAFASVAGGTVTRSSKYTLVTTTGQAPGGSGVAKSSKYELRGGVVGATQP